MNNIKDFKNKYDGERIFLVGNGPSLSETPLEEMDSEYTLAMNKINKIYSETSWRPSFYYFANPGGHSFSQEIIENISLGIPCFINSDHDDIARGHDNTHTFNIISLFSIDLWHTASQEDVQQMPLNQLREFWSNNVEYQVYHYHTMYGATQLSAYLGFDEIYFVGCDLGQEYQDPHMIFKSGLDPERYSNGKVAYLRDAIKNDYWKSLINGVAHQGIKRFGEYDLLNQFLNKNTNDHFISSYLNDRVIHDGPTHDTQIAKAHIATKRMCEEKGIKTYNATIGGELDVYERVDVNEIINA